MTQFDIRQSIIHTPLPYIGTSADSTVDIVLEDINSILSGATSATTASEFASFSGTIPGTSTPVVITANNLGVVGNSVTLDFNGSTTIATQITTWNIANPSNQVTLTTGDGTQTPSSGVTNLSNGTTTLVQRDAK